jgi:glycosyltransferase involved in cell wall biosynthesis
LSDRLYFVVPCYNEEEVLPETVKRLGDKLMELVSAGKISPDSRVLFVDDGSADKTWDMIRAFCREDGRFCGISLSRNRGHQNALLAGLEAVRGRADMAISMDADLQDDINAADKMVDAYLGGADVVYGVRSRRDKDTFFKRLTAEGYYKMLSALGCDIVFNHADYRLLSARALDALAEYGERDMFIRGVIPMLGFRTARVAYERGERFAGESKYPLRKMLKLASDGALSLSLRPLRVITWLGAALLLLAAALLVYSIVRACMGHTMLDWKIVTLSVWGVGGLILVCLGLVGEYVGRTFMEMKKRPRYHIGDIAGFESEAGGKGASD